MPRNLSFISGPHVITVQSMRHRELAPPASPPAPQLPQQQPPADLQADVEAPLLPPAPSAAALAQQKALRRQITFAQGLSWGERMLHGPAWTCMDLHVLAWDA